MKPNFVCTCGHTLYAHRAFYNKDRKTLCKKEKYAQCWFCAISGNWCKQFVGDNLRSLENLVK